MPHTSRRSALKLIGLGLGGTAIAPSLLLSACREAAADPSYSYQTFSDDQAKALRIIQDTIIPKTDTPSASELGSVQFADAYITHGYSPEERETFLYRLDRFAAKLKDEHGSDLDGVTPEQVGAMMDTYFVNYVAPEKADEKRSIEIEGHKLETNAVSGGQDTTSVDDGRTELNTHGQVEGAVARGEDKDELNGLLTGLRSLTLESYFASEEVGENVLNYQEVPGKWVGQLPLSEMPGGKAWSL